MVVSQSECVSSSVHAQLLLPQVVIVTMKGVLSGFLRGRGLKIRVLSKCYPEIIQM